MFSGFQSNGFQTGFQIVRHPKVSGISDLTGDMPSWEWLLFIEEQNRKDEERKNKLEKQRDSLKKELKHVEHKQEKQNTEVIDEPNTDFSARSIKIRLLEAEIRLIDEMRNKRNLENELIIVGMLATI